MTNSRRPSVVVWGHWQCWMEQRSAGFVCKEPEVNVFIFKGHMIHVTTVTTQLQVSVNAAETQKADEWTWLPAVDIVYKMGG